MKVNNKKTPSIITQAEAKLEYYRSHLDEFERLKARIGNDPEAQDMLLNLVFPDPKHPIKMTKYEDPLNLEEVVVDVDGNTRLMPDALIERDFALDVDSEIDIQSMLEILEPLERDFMILRFGLNGTGEHSATEIASENHISRQYVSRIIKNAQKKLQEIYKRR